MRNNFEREPGQGTGGENEIVYVEHHAGSFEDGLQICVLCGKVIADYTGHWVNDNPYPQIKGWPEGPIFITGTNPVTTTTERPLVNYGGNDPYTRKVIKCTNPHSHDKQNQRPR